MSKKTEEKSHKKADVSQKKAASPDALTKGQKKGDIELSESDLKAVAGGAQVDFFSKIK